MSAYDWGGGHNCNATTAIRWQMGQHISKVCKTTITDTGSSSEPFFLPATCGRKYLHLVELGPVKGVMMDFTEAVSIQHPDKNNADVSAWSKFCCCFRPENCYWRIGNIFHVGSLCPYLFHSHTDKYLLWVFLRAMVRAVQFCGLTSSLRDILFCRLNIADLLPGLPKRSHTHFPVVLCSSCGLAFGASVIITGGNGGIFLS